MTETAVTAQLTAASRTSAPTTNNTMNPNNRSQWPRVRPQLRRRIWTGPASSSLATGYDISIRMATKMSSAK
jgi:hypothetical protein